MELSVNPSLSLFLFRVDADISAPYIAVRQIDCAILRSEDKAKNKRRVSTEQAQRAQIRQILLNINLKSERATREEIAYLKNAGVLGKRAPSCSLLGSEDAVRLLMAFGKEDIATDLAKALTDYRMKNPLRDGTIRPAIDPQAIAPSIRVTFTTPVLSGGDDDSDTPAMPRSTRPFRHIAAAQPLYTPDYDSDTDDDGSPKTERKPRSGAIRRPGRGKGKGRDVYGGSGTSPVSGPALSMLSAIAPSSSQVGSAVASHLVSSATSHPLVQTALGAQPSSVSLGQMTIARPLTSFPSLRNASLTPKDLPHSASSSFLSSSSSTAPSSHRNPATSLASLLSGNMLPKNSPASSISSTLLSNNLPLHPSNQSIPSIPSSSSSMASTSSTLSSGNVNAPHSLPSSSSLSALSRTGRSQLGALGPLSSLSSQSQSTSSRSFLSSMTSASLTPTSGKTLGVFGSLGSNSASTTATPASGGIFGNLTNTTLLRKS